jgi:hypothetical protein
MFVRSYGFSIEAGNNRVTLSDLFSHMATKLGEPDNTKSNERRFYVDAISDQDFFRGLVVTVKDQKAFCELVGNEGGSFIISVKNLEGDSKLMEFNFFVVNKKNGLGIYQHYHQSCTPNTFASYLRARYADLSNNSKELSMNRLRAAGELTNKKEKQIKAEHYGALKFSILVHDESLKEVLSKFEKIKAFEFEYASISPEKIHGVPIGPYVKRMKEKVTFKPDVNSTILGDMIQQTVAMLKPRSGRVSVVDHVEDDDIPLSIRIANIPEHFGEQEYGVVAAKLDELNVDALSQHPVVIELVHACSETYKHIFMKKVK